MTNNQKWITANDASADSTATPASDSRLTSKGSLNPQEAKGSKWCDRPESTATIVTEMHSVAKKTGTDNPRWQHKPWGAPPTPQQIEMAFIHERRSRFERGR